MLYSKAKQNCVTFVKDVVYEEQKQTTIGNDVFIGANVTIIDGVAIGDGAVIGAGAVVVKDIPPYAVAVGVPAKVIKYRFDHDIIDKLLKLQWWSWSDEELHKVADKEFNVLEFVK
jgi:acetyltransferase-like isoleucine patch superfamily enzyme